MINKKSLSHQGVEYFLSLQLRRTSKNNLSKLQSTSLNWSNKNLFFIAIMLFSIILFSISFVIAPSATLWELDIDANGNVVSNNPSMDPSAAAMGFAVSNNPETIPAEAYKAIGETKLKVKGQEEEKPSAQEIARVKGKIISGMDPVYKKLKVKIESIRDYAMDNMATFEGKKARIEISDNGINIKDGVGAVLADQQKKEGKSSIIESYFAKIPGDMDLTYSEKKLVFTGLRGTKELLVGGYYLTSKTGAKVFYSLTETKSGKITFEGTLDSLSFYKDGDLVEYTSMKDGNFIINEKKEVEYAKFTATDTSEFSFTYKDRFFSFKAKKGSEIEFNPIGGKVIATNLDFLDFEEGKIRSPVSVEMELDPETGKVLALAFEKGEAELGSNGIISVPDKKNPVIYVAFDGRDISKYDLAVSYNGEKITIKGMVNVAVFRNSEGQAFNYQGKADNSLVEFDREKSFFNVMGGDCVFSNLQHEVAIENGESKVRLLDEKLAYKSSFTFAYKNSNDVEIKGYFNYEGKEGKGEYLITVSKDGKEQLVASIDLSAIKASYSSTFSLAMQDKTSQLSKFQSELDTIEEKLSRASGEEKEKLELDKLKVQNKLGILSGESIDDILRKNSEFRDLSKNSEVKRSVEVEIAELLSQKAGTIKVPNLYTVETLSYAQNDHAEWDNIPEIIKPEIDLNGNILAYYTPDGRRIEWDGKNTEIPENLKEETKALLGYLAENGGTLKNLQSYEGTTRVTSPTIKLEGYSMDSPQYKEVSAIVGEQRELLGYDSANPNEFASRFNSPEEAAKAYLAVAVGYSLGLNSKEANKLYDMISGDSEYSTELRVQAKIAQGLMNFNTDPNKNAEWVLKTIREAVAIDPTNVQAIEVYRMMVSDVYLSQYARLASNEQKFVQQDVDNLLGKSSAWTAISTLWQPGTNLYIGYLGGGDEIVEKMKQGFETGATRYLASQELMKLVNNGIDLNQYVQGTAIDKLGAIYNANNGYSSLSFSKIQEYMDEAGMRQTREAGQEMNGLEQVRQRILENHGQTALNEFNRNMERSFKVMAAIDVSIQKDPTLYKLASVGIESIPNFAYGGNPEDLKKAFNQDRIGSKIELSHPYALAVADTLLNPLTYLGLSGAVRAGIVSSFKFTATEIIGQTIQAVIAVDNPLAALAMTPMGLIDSGVKSIDNLADSAGTIKSVTRIDPEKLDEFRKAMVATGKYEDLGNGVFRNLENNRVIHTLAEGAELPEELRELALVGSAKATDAVASSADDLGRSAENAARGVDDVVDQAKVNANKGEEIIEGTGVSSGCFLADTQIMLADGSYKNIQDILIGDRVKAYDLFNNEPADADVTMTFVRKVNSYKIIEYEVMG